MIASSVHYTCSYNIYAMKLIKMRKKEESLECKMKFYSSSFTKKFIKNEQGIKQGSL
jgi:hypothetical protein